MPTNKGLLGINARNLLYIKPYNPKKAIRLADDKIKTKQFLSARGIPVPKLHGIIRSPQELEKYDFKSLPQSFVIKPNHGYGGEGIIPILEQKEGKWISAGGKTLELADLRNHINDIIDGRFSISNVSDSAFFEQYVISDDTIGRYSYQGLPDIRVVVHNLIPVMAMLRLPTKESGGKANLHQGAIGVGIDIGKGTTTYISYKNRIIDELPDGRGKIRGLKIPHWDDILLIASKVQLTTNLGYLAADICLDKNSGPVLLEINARAGLGVQIANLAPLRKRLERIEGVKVLTPAKGIRIAKDIFGNTVEKEIENLSGKQIISTSESVEVICQSKTRIINAQIDPRTSRSIIDEAFATKQGLLEDPDDFDDEKSALKLKFLLKGRRIQTVVDVEDFTDREYQMIIGTRDLKDFLIDPSSESPKNSKSDEHKIKKVVADSTTPIKKIDYHKIDQQLMAIDGKIKLLFHLRPNNLESAKVSFLKKPTVNPAFEYPSLRFNPLDLIDQLHSIQTGNDLLGQLFEQKKAEIMKKIALLENIDESGFTEISKDLFGSPTHSEFEECKKFLGEIDFSKKEKALYTATEAARKFEAVFARYGLKNWKVKLKENIVADCVAGKNNSLFVKSDVRFGFDRVESLIVHEIETHILTAENGKKQPYEIFNRGLADYLTTQEGLAMYNVERQRHISFQQNFKALLNVIAIYLALEHSFVETYQKLLALNIPAEYAFRSTLKAKRGFSDTSQPGAFTKDYIYYRGYHDVKKFIDGGGDLKELYRGKFNLRDLELIHQIDGVKPAQTLPHWLKK